MAGPLVLDRHAIEALCRKYAVRRLLLFGLVEVSLSEAPASASVLGALTDAYLWYAIYHIPIPVASPSLDRRLLRDDVHARLRDAIVDGTLAPGEQLRDLELAAWLGVSRTPVREALLRLAGSGLVESSPGRSTAVTTVDLRAVREARDVVAAMHELAVREAVGGLTRSDLARMRTANRRFRAAVARSDLEAALRADDDLHGVAVRVAANRAVVSVLDQLTPVLRRAERMRFSTSGGDASAVLHDELIRLCAEGDADAAAAVAFDTWHTLPTTGDPAPTDSSTTQE